MIQDYRAINMILYKNISLHGQVFVVSENIGKQKTFTKHDQRYLVD